MEEKSQSDFAFGPHAQPAPAADSRCRSGWAKLVYQKRSRSHHVVRAEWKRSNLLTVLQRRHCVVDGVVQARLKDLGDVFVSRLSGHHQVMEPSLQTTLVTMVLDVAFDLDAHSESPVPTEFDL